MQDSTTEFQMCISNMGKKQTNKINILESLNVLVLYLNAKNTGNLSFFKWASCVYLHGKHILKCTVKEASQKINLPSEVTTEA